MRDLNFLRCQVEEFFESKRYKESCRKRYRHTWDHLANFMATHNEVSYTPDIGMAFLSEWHEGKCYEDLTDRQKERYRHIDVLSDLIVYGYIRPCVHNNKTYDFGGELGIPFSEFIDSHRNDRTGSSLRRYEERIYTLYKFLADRNKTIHDFTTQLAIEYLKNLDENKNACDRDNTIMTIRVFIRYLCDCKLHPMPVISEILGHSTTESTTTYTRVSIDMLRQCALDVPFIPSTVYEHIYLSLIHI